MRFVANVKAGASFTDKTVSKNLFVTVALPPSVTINVTRFVPCRFVAVERVNVRLPVVPDKARFPFGTRVVLVVLTLTVRLEAAVSMSEMAKTIFVRPASSRTTRFTGTMVNVGG